MHSLYMGYTKCQYEVYYLYARLSSYMKFCFTYGSIFPSGMKIQR